MTESKSSRYESKRDQVKARLQDLPEVRQKAALRGWLAGLNEGDTLAAELADLKTLPSADMMTSKDASLVIRAGFATFLTHVESRVASYIGEAFYTIGPCGEELVGVLGALARPTDPMALHYRHLAVQMARQLDDSSGKSVYQVLLDRARGACISSLDPVSGGHHCALGGGPFDFYVTSTLASQGPPAVGRAMGIKLASRLLPRADRRFASDAISIVSVGDGSVNNGMFLSALNLARYAQHRSFKCPVLFVISNNDICISLRGYGYLDEFCESLKPAFQIFKASGDGDMLGLWSATQRSVEAVRSTNRPGILIVDKLKRRFGHAATDRQSAYLAPEEIASAENADPMRLACLQALSAGLVDSPGTLLGWFDELDELTERAFIDASNEPKLESRHQVVDRGTQPALADLRGAVPAGRERERKVKSKPQPMRTLMNEVFHELLETDPAAVYVGEDVRHGGYYRVTEDLATRFPERVQDVPPDETSVIGIGMGYAQSGLAPIVEIPYAKYLDCGADLFFEAVLTYWCTNGRQRDGMVIRLQGFDKGIFGGNFHTHNMLYLPPGLDVVCYSNGRDYVRGMRYAYYQAKHAGRIVMSVDSTNLLYRKGLLVDEESGDELDAHLLCEYPSGLDDMLDFETVVFYPNAASQDPSSVYVDGSSGDALNAADTDVIIFTYGNGVPTAFNAAKDLAGKHGVKAAVVDCPTVGRTTRGMQHILHSFPDKKILFADVCKAGQHPFGAVVHSLQEQDILQDRRWKVVAAPAVYNPLGRTLTFLDRADITNAALSL